VRVNASCGRVGHIDGCAVATVVTTGVMVLLGVLVAASVGVAEPLLRDDFDDLGKWKPLTFPKISQHSQYEVVEREGGRALKASSKASASGLVLRRAFDVYRYPVVHWRWAIDGVYRNGNAASKKGDDYPIRVYVIFEYSPSRAGLSERLKYSLAKKLHGAYPPHSGLNYIWANRPHSSRVLTSSYTDKAKLIVLQQGAGSAGTWQTETVNVLDDYREAFGCAPPRRACLAVMSDSDNTGDSGVGFLDFIEVRSAD